MGGRVRPDPDNVAVLLFAVALAQIACIGGALERAFRARALSAIEHVSVGLLLGCWGVATLSFVTRLVPGGTAATAATVALATVASASYLERRGVRPWPVLQGLRTWMCLAWLVTGALVMALVVAFPLGWDGLFVWALKARAIHESNGQLPAWYFSDTTRTWSHLDYPLQVPLLQAFVYDWVGDEHQVLAKAVTGLYAVAGLPFIYASTSRLTGRPLFGVGTTLLVVSTPQLLLQEGGALSGYIDFPLAVVYCAAAVALLAYVEDGDWRPAVLSSLLLCSAATLKNEGTVLALVLGGVGIAIAVRRRHAGIVLAVTVPIATTLLSWRAFLYWHGALAGQDFGARSVTDLLQRRDWSIVGRELAKELVTWSHWTALWPVVVSGLLVGLIRPSTRRLCAVVVLVTVAPLAFFQTAYLFSRWGDLALHIQSSLPRLLLQVAPLALVGAAYGVGADGRTGDPSK